VAVSFSAGVASLDLNDKESDLKRVVDGLLHTADSRMYIAKEQGRSRVCATGDAFGTFSSDHA